MTAESFKSVLNLHFHNIPSDVDKNQEHYFTFPLIYFYLFIFAYDCFFLFVSDFGDFTGPIVASGPSPDHDVTDSTLYLLS